MAEANNEMKDERTLVLRNDDNGNEDIYKVADMSDEAKVIYTKLDIISKETMNTRANLEFAVEKNEILQRHYLEAIKPLLESDDETTEEVEADEQPPSEEETDAN